jgi:hypothetical protein
MKFSVTGVNIKYNVKPTNMMMDELVIAYTSNALVAIEIELK